MDRNMDNTLMIYGGPNRNIASANPDDVQIVYENGDSVVAILHPNGDVEIADDLTLPDAKEMIEWLIRDLHSSFRYRFLVPCKSKEEHDEKETCKNQDCQSTRS